MRISRFLYLPIFLFLFLFIPQVEAASFSINPSSGTFPTSCEVAIDVLINTSGEATNAADLILLFNPNEVEIVDQDPNAAGVQIKNGQAYAVYAGNDVDAAQGVIRSTAFNVFGSFNGSGVYTTIVFKSKPGVAATSFTIDYTNGSSTDSNIANLNGDDILGSVTNAVYSFSGACNPDTQPPQVSGFSPANNATGVALNTDISFSLTDNQSGVNLDTLQIQVHDQNYISTSPEVSINGGALNYSIVVDPSVDFPDETEIVTTIQASDLDGNVMAPRVFRFNAPIPPPPAPPEPVCGNNIVEEGEGCEPPNTLGCNAECQIDEAQCTAFESETFEELIQEAQEMGIISPEQAESLTLQEEEVRKRKIVGTGTSTTSQSAIGGFSTDRVVDVVTVPVQYVAEQIGCTGNCLEVVFGNDTTYWYMSWFWFVIILLLLLMIAYWAWKRHLRNKR